MYKVYLFEQLESVPETFIVSALQMLPEERRQKARRYRRLIDRKNCVITYVMLKIALKECFRITDFTLQYGKYGKPYLVEYPDVYFNISHCCCGCVVAVADCPIGVDIQDIRHFSWEIAKRACCAEELELLERSTDKDREFTRMWAMKESYIKKSEKDVGNSLSRVNTLTKEFVQIIDKGNSVISICK